MSRENERIFDFSILDQENFKKYNDFSHLPLSLFSFDFSH